MKIKALPVAMAMAATLLVTACGKKPEIKFTETETEETVSNDLSRFDKTLAGEAINDIKSLYDSTDIFAREGYKVVSGTAYGDNGVLVAYSGVSDSKLVGYAVANGAEAAEITFEGIVISDDTKIYTINSQYIMLVDLDNNKFYKIDYEQKKYDEIEVDFMPTSLFVADNGERIYYTVADDCNIYQYIVETRNSVSVYEYAEDITSIEIDNVVPNNDKIIVHINSKNGERYDCLSIELQEYITLSDGNEKVISIGEVYIEVPTNEEYISIHNFYKPRVVDQFALDDVKENEKLFAFTGSPYIMSLVKSDEGEKIRFYSISAGIKSNEIIIPSEYTIVNASYLSIDQTMCFEVIKADGVRGFLLWDVESVEDILN